MKTTSVRGFTGYIKIDDTRNDGKPTTVSVYESSAAFEGPHCWLSLKGEAHLAEKPYPYAGFPFGLAKADVSAHLSYEKAVEVYAALGAWLKDVEEGRLTEELDSIGDAIKFKMETIAEAERQ